MIAPRPSVPRQPTGDFRVPVPERIREHMNVLFRRIKAELPKGWGATLLMFTYGAGGSMVYASTAQREDMVAAMQEFLRKQAS